MHNLQYGQEYWDHLYRHQDTGWDIGYPSPPLKEYIDQLPETDLSILVPGCGNGYEAGYLLKKGFSFITLIDISPTLTAALQKKFTPYLNKQLRIINGDFFEHKEQYDLILEQTFLSALPPVLRPVYVEQMHSLLHPGGKLVGVLFNRYFEESPPYGGTAEEYEKLFSEKFIIHVLEPCYNSIKPRAGTEVFINLEAKSVAS